MSDLNDWMRSRIQSSEKRNVNTVGMTISQLRRVIARVEEMEEENARLREHYHVEDGWCMQCGAIHERRSEAIQDIPTGAPREGGKS